MCEDEPGFEETIHINLDDPSTEETTTPHIPGEEDCREAEIEIRG